MLNESFTNDTSLIPRILCQLHPGFSQIHNLRILRSWNAKHTHLDTILGIKTTLECHFGNNYSILPIMGLNWSSSVFKSWCPLVETVSGTRRLIPLNAVGCLTRRCLSMFVVVPSLCRIRKPEHSRHCTDFESTSLKRPQATLLLRTIASCYHAALRRITSTRKYTTPQYFC